jgi:hypothetical protein
MKTLISIEILTKELNGYKRCKEKSTELHRKNVIDKKLHLTHLKNLTPKINQLEKDIEILKTHINDKSKVSKK